MQQITDSLNRKYGSGTVTLVLHDSYRNMEEILRPNRILIRLAEDAARRAGLVPSTPPIRGGTDGAMLRIWARADTISTESTNSPARRKWMPWSIS